MKTKKQFVVVAYDIQNTKNRAKISKLLEQYGMRINLSVFEIMVTAKQLSEIQKKLNETINPKTDTIAIYPICLKCYCKINRMPNWTKIPGQIITI
jgi:CRISPR-associated protein Cas2